MKKFYLCIVLMYCLFNASAQSWNINGNTGLATNSFLGTTDNKDLVFKANNKERGRLVRTGFWRFGIDTSYMKVDSAGSLSFTGSGVYKVALNRYVFQSASNPVYGLVLDSAGPQYRFTNKKGQTAFSVNAATGNGVLTGTLKIGTYTLPSTDGVLGQVLKTNGAGKLTWANDNSASFTAGSGIDIDGGVISVPNIKTDLLYNTGVGVAMLYSNTSGAGNTATGYSTLHNNTTGNENTANGYLSLYSNKTGKGNTAIGAYALFSDTMGSQNTAVGDGAMYANATGYGNTATGFGALFFNTDGSQNTASGHHALQSNTIGNDNTATGYQALFSNTQGINNAAFGTQAAFHNSVGSDNAAYGIAALFYNTTGSYNTAQGDFSLFSNDAGSYNTALGYAADVAATGLTNATAIGYNAQVDASDKVRIGNTLVGSIGGQVGWTSFSDGRFKKNIKEDVEGLKFINLLKPITYTVDITALNSYYDKKSKHDSTHEKMKATMQPLNNKASAIVHNGFIAQDVEKAAASLHYNFSGVDKPQTEDGLYGLRYADFVVPLVKAVQELSAKVDRLEQQLGAQQVSSAATQSNNSSIKITIDDNAAATLGQNIPNPFEHSTTIPFKISKDSKTASIVITQAGSGVVVKTINITGSSTQAGIDAGSLSNGSYIYTLYVDGKKIDSRQMVLKR